MQVDTITYQGKVYISAESLRLYLLNEAVEFRKFAKHCFGDESQRQIVKANLVEEIAHQIKNGQQLY